MKGIIFSLILGSLISWLLSVFIFDWEASEEAFETPHFVKIEPGVVACLTEESLQKYHRLLAQKDEAGLKEIKDLGLCSFFPKGSEFNSQKNACTKNNPNEIFESAYKITGGKFYMNCWSVN